LCGQLQGKRRNSHVFPEQNFEGKRKGKNQKVRPYRAGTLRKQKRERTAAGGPSEPRQKGTVVRKRRQGKFSAGYFYQEKKSQKENVSTRQVIQIRMRRVGQYERARGKDRCHSDGESKEDNATRAWTKGREGRKINAIFRKQQHGRLN